MMLPPAYEIETQIGWKYESSSDIYYKTKCTPWVTYWVQVNFVKIRM